MTDETVEPCRKDINRTLNSLVKIIKSDKNRVCKIKAFDEAKRRLERSEIDEEEAFQWRDTVLTGYFHPTYVVYIYIVKLLYG